MWRWARNVKGKGKHPEGPVGGINRIKEIHRSRAETHLHNKRAEAASGASSLLFKVLNVKPFSRH